MVKLCMLLLGVGLMGDSAVGMRMDLAATATSQPNPELVGHVWTVKKTVDATSQFPADSGRRLEEPDFERNGTRIDPDEPCRLCAEGDHHGLSGGFSCFQDEGNVFGTLRLDAISDFPPEILPYLSFLKVIGFSVTAYGTACHDARETTGPDMEFWLWGHDVNTTCTNTDCVCGQCLPCSATKPPRGPERDRYPLAGADLADVSVVPIFAGSKHYCAAYLEVTIDVQLKAAGTVGPTTTTEDPTTTTDGGRDRDPTPAPPRGPPPPGPDPSASGDPHVTNMAGERFDINAPGDHLMLRLPMDRSRPALLELRGHIEADELARGCGMYIRMVTLRGDWLGNSTVQVRPLKRDMPGSNDAGTAVTWPFSIRQSRAATDDGNWKSMADFTASADGGVQVLSDSVKVAARRQAEEFGSGAAGQAFEFVIKGRFSSEAGIVVSQGQRQSLNLRLKSLASLGERRLGGLLGTEPHSPEVEEQTEECIASKSREGIEDMRAMDPQSSRMLASA